MAPLAKPLLIDPASADDTGLPPAPLQPTMTPDVMPSEAPNVSAPLPRVFAAPTPGQQQIQSDQGQLQKVRWAQANPWGTENNHPGKVGKIAHVLSTAANIAGDIFAPGITANIPGSQLNMQEKEGSLAKRLNTEITDESMNQERGAQQAHLEQENANAPIEAADKHAQSEATTGHLNAETQAAQIPSLATAYAHAVQEAIKNGQDPSKDPIVQHLSDAIVGLQPGQNKEPTGQHINVVGPDGKPMVATFHPESGKTTDASGNEISNPQPYEKPNVTNVNAGTWSLQNDTDGNPILFNSKTGNTEAAPGNLARKPNAEEIKRNDLAGNVNENLDQLESILTRRPDLFGPVAGRMTKAKEMIGTSDPDVAQLKTIEDNLGMALQSAHGMRSAQHVAVSAESVLNGLKNSPQALSAAIKTARSSVGTFQHDVQNTNEAGRPKGGDEPPRPANVPAGYRFNQNGPHGAGWYK